MNENITYNCRKLKLGRSFFVCFTKDCIIHIKNHFRFKSFKINQLSIPGKMLSEINFNYVNRDEGGPPNTINSTYWENVN